jgi:hypothetical protein
MLSRLGLADIGATAETALYHGGSLWASYWQQTVSELRARLLASGQLDDRSIDAFLAQCADPAWWTQTIAFTAVYGRATQVSEESSPGIGPPPPALLAGTFTAFGNAVDDPSSLFGGGSWAEPFDPAAGRVSAGEQAPVIVGPIEDADS